MRLLINIVITICLVSVSSAFYLYGQVVPLSFDLRNYEGENYVTPVKEQEGGTCWAHAAMASAESNLLMNGNWNSAETETPNLSEYHLDWWNGFNKAYNQDTMMVPPSGLEVHAGGDYRVAAAYFARHDGAITDTTQDFFWFDNKPARKSSNYTTFYVRDIEWYANGSQSNNINLIKSKIMSHGALATCVAFDDAFISDNFIHYQNPNDTMLPNHALTIIGWDDTKWTQAAQPGAWLCKNSWGKMWGNNGYLWVSYYDKFAGSHKRMGAVGFLNIVDPFFDTVYYHDYHGWCDTQDTITQAMNAFVAKQNILLQAVSVIATADSVICSLGIYDDFNDNRLEHELHSQTTFIFSKGFHTIDIDDSLSIENGDDFYVKVSLNKGGHAFDRNARVPVLLGRVYQSEMVYSTAQPGESYYKNSNGRWVDFYYTGNDAWRQSANYCIKVLVKNTENIYNIHCRADFVSHKVFPNPVSTNLTIELETNNAFSGNILITNVLGEIFVSKQCQNGNTVTESVAHLQPGVYFYSVQTKAGYVAGQFVKQ